MGGQLLGRHEGWFQPPVVDVRWMDVDLALLLYGRGLCCEGRLPGHADCASEGLQELGRMAVGLE